MGKKICVDRKLWHISTLIYTDQGCIVCVYLVGAASMPGRPHADRTADVDTYRSFGSLVKSDMDSLCCSLNIQRCQLKK
ncbi:MAG: hypothetical protein BBJ57_13820 [Desulfobacterales bacterium PC51MH44]|nr:MAG: hypothetical protein BBJ57_13820 [Desulfobacterales bacterium PC51MH44]